jgi:hypothetical protein
MESIVRNVKDIDGQQRQWLEAAIGQQLKDNQQVVIRVLTPGVEPDQTARASALEHAAEIARKGRAHAEGLGISEEEINAAIEEGIRETRREQRPPTS